MHLDNDVAVFAITVAVVLITGIAVLRRGNHRIPVKFQLEEIPPEKLSEAQARFLASQDETLAKLYYSPTGSYRVTNYGHNLMRSYIRPGDPARCAVVVVEHRANVGSGNHVSQAWQYEFMTHFSDGRVLSTSNMKLKSLLDSPPQVVKQTFPSLNDPEEIKKRHEARAATMGAPVTPAMDLPSIFAEIQREHDRLSEYRVKQGNYRIEGDFYQLTDRVFWRGIRNFLNPFVHRFSVIQFVSALFAAAALPYLGLMRLVPAAVKAAARNGYPEGAAFDFSTAVCYLVTGAVIGYALEKHTFIWVFLLCVLGVHAAMGWNANVGWFGFLASLAGHYVSQVMQRRQIFLLPQKAN